jgi:hypothetical protein
MFWYGEPLSRLERLSIASFLANGHPVDLYAYDDIGVVPAGAQIKDAAKVLPREFLFHHRRTGSVGLFSDWFRYRLLHAHGGIWADCDIVCLAPLDYADDMIFGWENERYLNNAVLGFPKGHEIAAWLAACCENPNRILPYDSISLRFRKWRRRFLQGDRRDRIRWGEYGPKGLTHAVRYFELESFALPVSEFYDVPFDRWHTLYESSSGNEPWMQKSRALHFANNQIRKRAGFDKNARFPDDSPFERLWRRYLKNDG